jgi:predicted TPR repeat methyltransferase
VPAGHLFTRVQVSKQAAATLDAERLDVVTERLAGRTFDLVVATNVFPYFDDEALMLALVNIAGMLGPDGWLLHNEARPALHDVAAAIGLPPTHSRHAVIATVRGAPPLGDSVWLHGHRPATGR